MHNFRTTFGLVFWLLGVAALMALIAGRSPWFWPPASVCLLAFSMLSNAGLSRWLGVITAVSLPAYLAYRAGPLSSFSPSEWAWFLTLAVLLLLVLWLPGRLWRAQSRIIAISLGLLAGVAVPATAVWISNHINQVVLTSRYVTMPDGVRIAVDVNLPRDLDRAEQIPTALNLTRYHRNQNWRFPHSLFVTPWAPGTDVLTRARIAWVKVDLRGSGASEGGREIAFNEQEVRDGQHIVDWIIDQPWSDGSVVSEGGSYVGTAAENLLSLKHPAVKGAMPTFSLYDPYRDIIWPGGLYLEDFVNSWTVINKSLDANEPWKASAVRYGKSKGVRPVDEDRNEEILSDIVARRQSYLPADLFKHFEFSDSEYEGKNIEMMSSWGRHDDIKASATPMFMVSGWYDGAYPNGSIKRMLNIFNPGSRLLIGPWDHGGRQLISPCKDDPDLAPFNYLGELISFVNHVARRQDTPYSDRAPVSYYTMCGAGWQSADHWPPDGLSELVLFLSPNGALTRNKPSDGTRSYEVDFEARSTVGYSRWFSYTNMGGMPIGYHDRAERDLSLLVYDSEPLAEGLEITGHPVITLHMSVNDRDAAVFVYLEDVGPDGDVRYITEGQIRAAHRKITAEPLPFRQIGVNRSFKQADLLPLTPGETFELKFELLPTSYFVRPGRRIRIAIAGADAAHFKLPETAADRFEVHSLSESESQLILPVKR